jgi:hypothetical protein
VQVISKLSDGKSSHIPYRDSKLTRLLQSSLSGHGRVSVRLCISMFKVGLSFISYPLLYHLFDSIYTLVFEITG